MTRVRFLPMEVMGDAQPGESLFEVAQRLKVSVSTSCVGKGTCGLCRVKIVEGRDQLSPYSAIDEKHLGNVYHLTQMRLSCQAIIEGQGDVVVQVPAPRRSKKQR